MSAPDFVAQTGEAMSSEERSAWCLASMGWAKAKGATWHRYSHDLNLGLLLYEGWKVRPVPEPAPHFQLTAKAS